MDNSVQDYVFLDLSDLGEADLNYLRLVLGTKPQQQGLTLPWSDEDAASSELPIDDQGGDCSGPVGDGPCDWLASPDGSTHIQFGEPMNGGGHLDQASDIELTSGEESSQTAIPEDVSVITASTSPSILQSPNMGSVVATTSSQPLTSHADSSLMHGPPTRAYQPSQQPEEHAVYSNMSYVPHNVMYQHPMSPYAVPPPVSNYQMIDAQQQPPRDQVRGRGRKSVGKSRDNVHHNQEMMPRGHLQPHAYEGYAPQYYPASFYPYQQMQPVHQATGSPIFLPYHVPYEFSMTHQGPKVPSQHGYSQAIPVSVPVPPATTAIPAPAPIPTNITAPVPVPSAVPAGTPLPGPPLAPPPAIIPVHMPNQIPVPPIPDAVPIPAAVVSSPIVPTVPPVVPNVPAPAPIPTQTSSTTSSTALAQASLPATPVAAPLTETIPTPVPVTVNPPPSVASTQATVSASAPSMAPSSSPASAQPPAATSNTSSKDAGNTTVEQARVSISRAVGPPSSALLSRRPVDPKKPVVTPKLEAQSTVQPEEKPNPRANQPLASATAPPQQQQTLPASFDASVPQPAKTPSPEPPSSESNQSSATSAAVQTIKTDNSVSAPVQSSGSQWGKASFASLFSKESSSPGGQIQSSFSSSSTSNAVPSSYAYNNSRSDGPQAVSPPTQSGWGPMQPPPKASSITHSHSRPPPGAVPSGPAPGLPLPNPSQDPKLYLLSEFLHQCKLEHKPASFQPRGLTNRNNWCYINATLQALLACPPFYNLFNSMPDPPTNRNAAESRTPIMAGMRQFVKEFIPLPASARLKRADRAARSKDGESAAVDIPTGPAFEPTSVYRMLSVIRTDTMVEGRQEDAEEFLSCLLNGLNDEMLEVMKVTGELPNGDVSSVPPLSSPNGETEPPLQGEYDEWKTMTSRNKGAIIRRPDFGRTPLSDIFRGELRSRVVRTGNSTHENHITDNIQPFFTLQLDIEKSSSVKKALEQYVESNQLEGVTCSRSKQEVNAWQEVQLEELPPVLLLHLKCFDYSQDGCSKILKTIQYDVDLKVDSKLLSCKKKPVPQYKLFAVVYHDGKEATKGHYITDAFHVGHNQWIRYDDSSVQVVTLAQVLGPKAPRVPYLLYYRRLDTIEKDRH